MSSRPLPPGLFQKREQLTVSPPPANNDEEEAPAEAEEVIQQPPEASVDAISEQPHQKEKKKKHKAHQEGKKHKKKDKKKRKEKKHKSKHSKRDRSPVRKPDATAAASNKSHQFAVWSLRQKCWITQPAERNAKGRVEYRLTSNYFPRMEGVECPNPNAGDVLELRDYNDPENKRYEQLDLSRYNVFTDPNWDLKPEALEARDMHAAMLAETDEEDYHPHQDSVDGLIASLRHPKASFHDKRRSWHIELAVYTAKKTGKSYIRISRIVGRPKKAQNLKKQLARQRAIDRELRDLVAVY